MSPLATSAPAPIDLAAPAAPPRSDLAGSTAESLLVVVAPSNGRFEPLVSYGRVEAGTVVGRVTTGRGTATDVRVPATASIAGLLTLPGHLVTRGQALAWARIESADAAA